MFSWGGVWGSAEEKIRWMDEKNEKQQPLGQNWSSSGKQTIAKILAKSSLVFHMPHWPTQPYFLLRYMKVTLLHCGGRGLEKRKIKRKSGGFKKMWKRTWKKLKTGDIEPAMKPNLYKRCVWHGHSCTILLDPFPVIKTGTRLLIHCMQSVKYILTNPNFYCRHARFFVQFPRAS